MYQLREMDIFTTMTREKSARNGAAASYLRTAQAAVLPKISYQQIADKTGIKIDTVKRLMTNKSEITMDQFSDIAAALGVAPADALAALAEIVRKQ